MKSRPNPPNSPKKQQEATEEVKVSAGPVTLDGMLGIPGDAKGIVVFAHGSGSSRFSPRNQYVAEELRKAKLGTLLFDLLTPEEEEVDMVTGHLRFNINLLSERVIGATDWLTAYPKTKDLTIGYFGASTGTAAALVAASERPDVIAAIVSRGGRPDLAGKSLPQVKAPTLLIVGGNDFPVIDMNQDALEELRAEKKLVIVPGATHLFEEPGTLEEVSRLTAEWFVRYFEKTGSNHNSS